MGSAYPHRASTVQSSPGNLPSDYLDLLAAAADLPIYLAAAFHLRARVGLPELFTFFVLQDRRHNRNSMDHLQRAYQKSCCFLLRSLVLVRVYQYSNYYSPLPPSTTTLSLAYLSSFHQRAALKRTNFVRFSTLLFLSCWFACFHYNFSNTSEA